MSTFYGKGLQFLGKSYSEWSERDPKEIQDAIGSFLKGMGNMMSSAALARSNGESQEIDVRRSFILYI